MGYTLQEQRLDAPEVGEGTTVTLIDGKQPAEWAGTSSAAHVLKLKGAEFKRGRCVLHRRLFAGKA